MLVTKRQWSVLSLLLVFALLFTACAAPTPEIVEKEVVVKEVVKETVIVEKERVVEKEVIQTVEVEKEVVVEKVVTATPAAERIELPKKMKVAFVYVAPIGDMGWTYAHDQARLKMEAVFGDMVETAYIENVPEGPDAERVIRDFAQKGYDVIFTTSFGFMDPTIAVAAEFPDKWFVHISGYKTAENVSTVFGKIEEPRYVSGLVAGKQTQTNKIGYVAAFPIPEVVRGINSFTLGVRAVNPAATVHVVWTNTWFDPVKEKEAAVALLDEGCDVIAQHQDTPEPQKAAEERGLWGVGYDSDMSQQAPDAVLTSPVWNWAAAYIPIVQAVAEGTYSTESYWGGWQDGVVDLAPFGPMVPGDVQAMAEKAIADFKAGKQNIYTVFTGPINANDGQQIVPPGVSMNAEQLLNVQWFVEGVVGTIPGVEPPEPIEAVGKEVKAAFVYVGPVGDMGWSYAHNEGRIALEEDLGIETTYVEAVPEGADATRVLRDLAGKGYNLIFATSFGYMDSVIEVAADFPDVAFEHCTGYKIADNVGIYDGRGYQGWYLAGMVAGQMTTNNVLGYVAPYLIPEVVRNMNAFTLGARFVNPDVKVHFVLINAWFDPAKEREAAQALIDLGADVVARESDSAEPDKLAEENGVYAIGYNTDSIPLAPDAVLVSPIWDWGVFYKEAALAVMNGTWDNTPYWGTMGDGIIKLSPFGEMVPEDARELVLEKQAEIVSGEFDVFVGPINDNEGDERVAAGELMSDEDKLSFNWLVEGIEGSLPTQ